MFDALTYEELHQLSMSVVRGCTSLYHEAEKLWHDMGARQMNVFTPGYAELTARGNVLMAAAREQGELHVTVLAEMRARRAGAAG